jgi:hypothetical protein
MNRKTLLILVGAIVVIILGIGIYFWLNSYTSNQPPVSGSPFGSGGGNSPTTNNQQPTSNQNASQSTSNTVVSSSGLRKIADGPISGATIFARASTTIVRYVDKATGNIYEYDTGTNATTRISNTTMPKIEEVSWGNNGNALVMRFLKDSAIESYFGTLSASTTATAGSLAQLVGNYLPENINSLSFSPLRDKIFYTLPSTVGIEAFVADKNGGNPKSVWQFATTEWMSQWVTENSLTLTTKASNGISGSAFSLNLKTGSFFPSLSNVPGLTTLTSPDGNLILYSQSQGSITSLNLYDGKNNQTEDMPFITLPEKCLWGNTTTLFCAVPNSGMDSYLPDTWYQGFVSFGDTIWKGTMSGTKTPSNTANNISNMDGNSIDAIKLALSPDGKTLIFENKKDYSLWLLPLQ